MTSALPLERRLVYVVDDEPAVRAVIRLCLDEEIFEVMEFGDADAAVAALELHVPELIFLDLQLGRSDAIEAMRAFSEQGYAGSIQLMSGRGEAVLEGVQAAATRYAFYLLPPLSKPFRARQIRAIMEDFKARPRPPVSQVASPQPTTTAAGPHFSLNEALEREWLELWYQPKVDLQSGATIGAEGLIRARHPRYGIVGPFAFLPGARDEALFRLTELVLLTCLRDWSSFFRAGHPLQLSVNVPSSALLSMPISQIVREHRPRADAWPGLILEVTEDQLFESVSLAQEIAAQLQIYGVRLSLDDFGQGYSSLSRLRDLPFQELKIDRSFVTGSAIDPTKRDLCRTIIDLAHRFGCTVVAEGIETAADLEAVKDAGCDHGQGYLLGRPMHRDELIRRLGDASMPNWLGSTGTD